MLGYVLVAAALLLGILTGNGLLQIAGFFIEGLTAWSTIQLLVVVTLIDMLTVFLDSTGALDRILAALRSVVRSPRVLIALVPSILGLFPVPGGAILSAPMVGKYGDEIGLGADEKAAVNLFYRHGWDQVFPFKPNLLLASTVLNVPLFVLIGWQLPVTILGVVFGYWYLVDRRAAAEQKAPSVDPSSASSGLPLWVEVAPLVIPLVLSLGTGIDFVYAIAAGLAFGLITQRVQMIVLRKMIGKGVHFKLLFTLASVMMFKAVVEHSGAVGVVADLFSSYGVPLPLLAVVLPLLVGLITGIEPAVVAMVFPLLNGMIPESAPHMPYILIMMVAGSVGSIISPAHLCMAAGNEYYGTSLGRVVRLHLLPQAVRLGGTAAFAWLLYGTLFK